MQATDLLKNIEEEMKKGVAHVQKELQGVRTGRANPGLLDRVMVDYYGVPTPIKQVSNISTPDGKCLVIQPYEKGSIKEIEIAINKADIGLTPTNDGNVVRVSVPSLTEERRKDLVKLIKKFSEDGKIHLRNARRDGLEGLKKLEVSTDESKKQQDQIQKLTDKFSKEIDELAASKEKEVLTV
jgi:ribosome recycling factor